VSTRLPPLLLALGLLLSGCSSAETPPDEPPATTQPSPTTIKSDEDTPEPAAPPLGHPRPKVGPGSVMLDEEARGGVR
jgi:hypothetical protein